jgi:hypothetical protein
MTSTSAERPAANVLYDEIRDLAAEARGEVGHVAERLAGIARVPPLVAPLQRAATPATPLNTATTKEVPDDSFRDANPHASARARRPA